ncbi:post-GPI attachment to proteins factor 6 isoform X2 [Ambystoma mexicanum]|uniref:post-GPI attachment to proteins factor 6 isoform X2 n=1 Tax=Ambystoma mexicanum TaxID=8296 RepID=UPI0037E70752
MSKVVAAQCRSTRRHQHQERLSPTAKMLPCKFDLLVLLQLYMSAPAISRINGDLIYISEFVSESAQHLSFYSWYGNVRLYRFQVPEDTVLLRWLLQASRGRGPECQDTDVTVHFRYGAPPVINPLGHQFSKNTTFRPPYSMALRLSSNLHNNTFVNVTNPAPGDWFIAAHLPQADQKMGIKGFSSLCTYIFQPDMFLLRAMNVDILEPDSYMEHNITSPIKPVHLKIFIPAYTLKLKFRVRNCAANTVNVLCPVRITLGLVTMPQSFQKKTICTGSTECSMSLDSPPWEAWVPITLESFGDRNVTVSLETSASLTECKPSTAGSSTLYSFFHQLNVTLNTTALLENIQPSTNETALNTTALAGRAQHFYNASRSETLNNFCMRNLPVIREDLDVVSIRFRTVSGPFVSIPSEFPIVIPLKLNSGMDNGGIFIVSLLLNKTTLPNSDATVIACLSTSSPVLLLNGLDNCTTAFFQGYLFKLNASITESACGIPFPETGRWYLSMQVICPKNQSACQKVKTKVMVSASLNPCLDDCGPYGECRLLRRHGYLYAACSCKAVWAKEEVYHCLLVDKISRAHHGGLITLALRALLQQNQDALKSQKESKLSFLHVVKLRLKCLFCKSQSWSPPDIFAQDVHFYGPKATYFLVCFAAFLIALVEVLVAVALPPES